jgi:hypothetical protein
MKKAHTSKKREKNKVGPSEFSIAIRKSSLMEKPCKRKEILEDMQKCK